jgi:glutathione peroxidase-family protein
VLDNSYKTWNAYRNQYWPALYLVDREGNVVYRHYGEGDYDVTEREIRRLLASP